MARLTDRALMLALYTAMMWAAGWALRQIIPPVDAWIVLHAGEAGAWAAIIVPCLAGALYLWRDSSRRRRAGLPSR